MKKFANSFLRCLLVFCLFSCNRPVYAAQGITAVWANDGEDKVTRDELRATKGANVKNTVWDGGKISLFGARNEVVAFNVILEAAGGGASNVTVSFNSLVGPNGTTITSSAATGNGVFNWAGRNIELFYVRYLQINGLSLISYPTSVDERQVPRRFARPWTGSGVPSGTWQNRPDHNKFYPEIAIPLELTPTFKINAASNQSVWVDVYIPKTAQSGNYLGTLLVRENGGLVASIPVQLKVYNFALPDTPNSKTMVAFDSSNINKRFLGATYFNPSTAAGQKASLLRDRYAMLAHRHRISLIGDNQGNDCATPVDQPCADWLPRLDGSLFSASNGYDGPGVNVGNNIYSIGTYGHWNWNAGTEADMRQHTDAWATWFSQNAPSADYFLYLIDESANTAQIQTWAQWMVNNPGPGNKMRSMATINLLTAAAQCALLDIPTSTLSEGITSAWEPLVQQYTTDSRKQFYMYNGHRPASGSFATEDDGIALRELAWGQYKKHIHRWFFWEGTYYNNYQGGAGETNVFQTAQTFGTSSSADPIVGQTGWNYANGDGVLFYPGTDTVYPSDSYGVDGAFASLRLKYWRRGIQDVDYLTLAAGIDPTKTQAIVNQIVPKVLWEYGVDNPNDPTYIHSDISWSNNPDVWESARQQLAAIIAASPGTTTAGLPAPTLNLPPSLPVNAQISADYPSGYDISSFQWSIVPVSGTAAALARKPTASARSMPSTLSTPSATAQLDGMNLVPGYYQISVFAIDSNNNTSPSAQANVNLVSTGFSAVQVFPNPWRADQSNARQITFDHLPDNASVLIFTVSGHLVKTLTPSANKALWDLTNDSGDRVGSGVYMYLIKSPDGQSRGKLAIIK